MRNTRNRREAFSPFGKFLTLVLLCGFPAARAPAGHGDAVAASETTAPVEPAVIDVEPVWSGHRVGFCLLTHPPHQFVAYYDQNREMTVAQRRLGEAEWKYTRLPSRLGWDSHNYVTMAVDRDGYLHLAGNMHCVPLMYFRSEQPLDASSLVRVAHMVGSAREQQVTYPVFLRGPDEALIFRYRDGRSGDGDDIYNRYDEQTRTWQRLLDSPLTSGEGRMNAYCSRPVLGPDDHYHIIWVWRDTPDCATNHDLSYARSADLMHWQTGDERILKLPITIDQQAVVDPVPPGGGLINGGARLGFDSRRRPIVTYHKYDAEGNTQPYAARLEGDRWVIRRIDDWGDYRWDFQGGGSIEFEVGVSAVQRASEGVLRVDWRNGRGRGSIWLDESTLTATQAPAAAIDAPAEPSRRVRPAYGTLSPDPAADFPGIQQRSCADAGQSGDPDIHYRLRWHTLGPNRDRPRTGPLPPPSMLRVIREESR